jgi:hypothetical protein
MATSKKDAASAGKALREARGRSKLIAASDLQASSTRRPPRAPEPAPHGRDYALPVDLPRPESVDEETIARLVAEAEDGIPAEKLRRRGRPAISEDAASTYSVRLPDDLVTLTDERSEIDCVTRGETIRRALIEYLTK